MKKATTSAGTKKMVLVCTQCANDPTSYRNDDSKPRGHNITRAGSPVPYCYDCGESHSVEKVQVAQ